MQEQLDRIEVALEGLNGKLDELLKRKRAPAQHRQSEAEAHDTAVALSAACYKGQGHELEVAWRSFCATRRKPRKYLSNVAINVIWKKLNAFPIAEQVRALEDSVANGWSGVFPKAQEGGATGQDWFSKEDK